MNRSRHETATCGPIGGQTGPVHTGTVTLALSCALGIASYFFGQPMAIELHWFWMFLGSLCIVVLAIVQYLHARTTLRRDDELRAVLDAAPHSLFFKDAGLRYRIWNQEFERAFGVQVAPGVGDAEIFGSALHDRFGEQDRQLMRSGEAVDFDDSVEVDGVRREFHSRKRVVRDRRGRVRGIVGVSIDVTEDKRLQRQLHDAHEKLGMALGIGGLGVWRSATPLLGPGMASSRQVLRSAVFADAAIRGICGFGPDAEIHWRDLRRLLHPDDRPRVARALAQALRLGAGAYGEQFRIRGVDGVVRTVDARGSLSLLAQPGSTVAAVSFIGIARDISAEEALKSDLIAKAEEARAALDAKRQFLAMMSHEVRTPLTGVLGMIDLTLDTRLDAAQRTMLRRSRESSLSLLAIINDILDFSKVEAGRMELEDRPLSLADLIEDVCMTLMPEAARKAIGLDFMVADDLPEFIVGDAVRLRQVLTNLIGNAVKFTAKGGVNVVAERGADATLALSVEDSGIGIEPAAARAIFEPFVQADIATTRRYGGTGLGLTIVKQLVELMHGRVRCKSRPGVGSRFTVGLPLRPWTPGLGPLPPKRDAAPREAAPVASGSGRRLLLAEDHPINREVITMQLARLGFECDCAEDGQEAWDRLLTPGADYALLLTDCHMPRLNGWDLTTRLRAREAALGLDRLPIVGLTANALQGERERCLALGMDGYLSKPLQLEGLRQVLDEVLGTMQPWPR